MVVTCDLCNGIYKNLKGLRIHRASCEKHYVPIKDHSFLSSTENNQTTGNDVIETVDILSANEILLEHNFEVRPNLPMYPERNDPPRFSYCDINGVDFSKQIDDIYNEIVKWRKNLSKLPSGNTAKVFIKGFNSMIYCN